MGSRVSGGGRRKSTRVHGRRELLLRKKKLEKGARLSLREQRRSRGAAVAEEGKVTWKKKGDAWKNNPLYE